MAFKLDAAEGLAFGFVRLKAFPEGAEWGSIELDELEALTVSLPVIIHSNGDGGEGSAA